ncbi:hypothetical protein EEL32_25450 [Brevibacillus laterosporus]|nr:hypothetical protein [Brevibacillus laterosporus]TPG74005.1 hypothetical protein EEL32_25450 [Brevibacillus laterosporus]
MNKVRPYKGPRVEIQGEQPGEMLHVAKRVYDAIHKKATITNTQVIDRKIVIEYKSKNGKGHGVMELYDIGPMPIKKENTK